MHHGQDLPHGAANIRIHTLALLDLAITLHLPVDTADEAIDMTHFSLAPALLRNDPTSTSHFRVCKPADCQ
jgi:hypothetical protein